MNTVLRQAARSTLRARPFSTSSAVRKDLVQDLYINQLKAYKAPPVAKDAHVGVVKQYSTPATPKAPALPADIASELAAYDAADPVKAPAVTSSGALEPAGAGAEAFLEHLEADEPVHAAAH